MPRYKLTIEYDGSGFSGWQRQENGPSIQQVLENAFLALTGRAITLHGAGRTDAGVHAIGQVAHVDLARDWNAWRLREAVNAHLVGRPIAVLEVEPAADAFDARHSAVRRCYLYRVVNRRAPLGLELGRAWRIKRALDEGAMREAARMLIGRHDFSTFRDSQCQANSPLRTLDRLEVTREGDRVEFAVSARSFLHRQVRSMVGSLIEVGSGKWSAGDLRSALEAADRSRCGPVAPACGLYLARVEYAPESLRRP
jgi:tRNA pseudouridine38-40 synthase